MSRYPYLAPSETKKGIIISLKGVFKIFSIFKTKDKATCKTKLLAFYYKLIKDLHFTRLSNTFLKKTHFGKNSEHMEELLGVK